MMARGEYREKSGSPTELAVPKAQSPTNAALNVLKKMSPFSGNTKNKKQIMQGMQMACDNFDNVENLAGS